MDLAELVQREAIRDVLHRYCRGADRRDATLMRSAYHSDALDHHGGFDGRALDFIELLIGTNASDAEPSQHLLGNIMIELDGDRAWVESVFTCRYGRTPTAGDRRSRHVVLGGRYWDRFERRDGDWRIAERTVLLDWSEERPTAPRPAIAATFVPGVRGSGDRTYHRPTR